MTVFHYWKFFYFLKYPLHHHYKDWNEVNVSQLCWLIATPWTIQSMEFSWQNTGLGSLSLLQGIFPIQESNPGLLHCRKILYQLSHKGRPRILEWVAYPSPVALPDPGIEPGSPALQADSLLSELPGKPIIRTISEYYQSLKYFLLINLMFLLW